MGGCLGEWAAAAAGRWWRINNGDGDEDENDQCFFTRFFNRFYFCFFLCSSRCQPVRGTEGRGMSLGNAVTAAAAE